MPPRLQPTFLHRLGSVFRRVCTNPNHPTWPIIFNISIQVAAASYIIWDSCRCNQKLWEDLRENLEDLEDLEDLEKRVHDMTIDMSKSILKILEDQGHGG
ncbi:Protein of unknown function [Pyronema omphalodes CBS 100304]|uniref:Uncharacterized protein n=1 Tax=Pyronema omphalodes (strain CBS 100304) TaxID=1076935 RepID=U4L7X0_PYROM|nr:Protein of unknown function [Pyronema omphalodes CBS 100304]